MKKKKKVLYFAEREEKGVVDYINSNSKEEKDQIYNEILIEPFRKMIQSILRVYPIYMGNYEMEEVEQNALTHLIEHMVKFNPDKINKSGKKTRAFSYCQTIVRNYFKDHGKKTYNEKKINLNYDDYVDEINESENYRYEISEDEEVDELELLIKSVVDKIYELIDEDNELRDSEIIVGEAIANILNNWEILFLEDSPSGKYNKKVTNKFAKNKILFFLKEQTGLNTKEIRLAMKPYREIYFFEKTKFLDD